jgi:hypothetical protein
MEVVDMGQEAFRTIWPPSVVWPDTCSSVRIRLRHFYRPLLYLLKEFLFDQFFVLSTLRLRACDTSMPPSFAFHAFNVALLISFFRHTSAVFIPPSCSRSTAIFCSLLNLVFLTSVSSRRRTVVSRSNKLLARAA